MSWSACPVCGGMLEGHPGTPCTNPACFNSRAVRDREAPRYVAPLTGQVTRLDADVEQRRARKATRKAARVARRHNRKDGRRG